MTAKRKAFFRSGTNNLLAALLLGTGYLAANLCAPTVSAAALTVTPTPQSIDVGQGSSAPRTGKGHVTFAAEPQILAAAKPATLILHFHVDPGFHINSHAPKSDMLIPTKIAISEMSGDTNVTAVDFPPGTPYSFSFEPNTKLDVYTGDFTLTAHLTAQTGLHTLKAALHYQACDAAACYPPKALPVQQPFTAK